MAPDSKRAKRFNCGFNWWLYRAQSEWHFTWHEEPVEEFCEKHPSASHRRAYDLIADAVYDRDSDRIADLEDEEKWK